MADNNVIQKCDSNRPYRNNVVSMLTGPNKYQTIEAYVEPTGTFANSIFSPSGEIPLAQVLTHAGEIIQIV